MKVSQLDVSLLDLLPAGATDRSRDHSGIHVSDLVRDLWVATGGIKKRDSALDMTAEQAEMEEALFTRRIELGVAFEQVFQEKFVERLNRYHLRAVVARKGGKPGRPRFVGGETIEVDGIKMTLDFEDMRDAAVAEVKLTWKSAHYPIGDARFWGYLRQLMAYCYGRQRFIGRLYVFFVNGDYRPPAPDFRAWEFQFDMRDLVENWGMLLGHAVAEYRLPKRVRAAAQDTMNRRLASGTF